MSSSIGIYASQISGHLVTNNYSSIQTVTVGSGGASSITFSSIPSTYTHLQLRGISRSDASGTNGVVIMYLNGVTTASGNYSTHLLRGNGSSASAYGASGDVIQGVSPASSASSNVFGASIWDILDYTNTNKNKVVRTLSGEDNNGDGIIQLSSGMLYSSQAAVTSITLVNNSSANFLQYSSFALYGVK